MDNWKLENLLQNAYLAFKDRLVNYLIAVVITAPFYLCIGLSSLIFVFFYQLNFFHQFNLFKLVAIIVVGSVFTLAMIYLSAWAELVKIKVLINPTKISPLAELKEVKSLVNGFVVFQLKSLFFYLWLVPISFLTFFITPVLWIFWSMFTSFVYLEKRKKGLENLWYSRALVMKNQTTIFLRMLVIAIFLVAIEVLIPNDKNIFISFIKVIINLVFYPFCILFNYQIYKNIEEPYEVKPSYNWLIAGGIGWLVALTIALVWTILLLLK